jgi:hypothetical protein
MTRSARTRPATALLLAGLGLALGAAAAKADFPCDELWGERNAVYADAGYCFRTERGIRAFGREGCRHDDIADVPLSARDRRKVAEIQAEERRNGCPR